MSGASQAVRIPFEFRFDSKEVNIRKEGDLIILEPIHDDWSWLDDVFGNISEDFMANGRE